MSFGDRRAPLKRTGIKRGDPAKNRDWQDRSRKALPARSTKGAARQAEATAAGARAKARDGGCIARPLVPEVRCWGPLDPQHVIPRSTAPELVADEANIVGCCRGHHQWIESEPIRARQLGLHGHAGDDLTELARRRTQAR